MYSAAAMVRAGDVTTEQMESIITAAYATTNEAAVNSDITFTVELVHVAQV